jgi:ABC-2 type transport system ATP-binding protein
MAASLILDTLTKQYPGTAAPALDAVTLQVESGEVYGFLGANGAGKSTSIRTLMGFIQPTAGSATVMGLDIVRDTVAVKRHVGYLSGDVALYPHVTGHELFAYLSKLHGVDTKAYLSELIERFEAEPEKKISELSKGNRQKIGVIQALMHKPDVLIMDEPTSGLDPLMQEVFYQVVREASARGSAAFISSHNLAEAQRMCHRVGIIKHGKLIREQAIKDDASLGTATYRVVLKDATVAKQLRKNPTLKILSVSGPTVTLQPIGALNQTLRALAAYDVVSLTSQQVDLEDEFLEYYGDGA